jgi:hypothetical protein
MVAPVRAMAAPVRAMAAAVAMGVAAVMVDKERDMVAITLFKY